MIQLTIDSKFSPSAKRILAVTAAAIALGVAAVAYAGVPQFTDGEVLTADKLNGNFNGLDARLAALEVAAGTTLFSESGTTEHGAGISQDHVYQSAFVDLTPGTWRLDGFASMTTTASGDGVQLALWNDTGNVEIPHSRSGYIDDGAGGTCGNGSVNCEQVSATTATVVTVNSPTRVRLKGFRNGTSIVWFGSPAAATVGLPLTNRIVATKLK